MSWFSPRAYFHFDFFCKGEEKMAKKRYKVPQPTNVTEVPDVPFVEENPMSDAEIRSEKDPAEVAKEVKPRLPDKCFVLAYVGCSSYEELAKETGLSDATCRSRASKLRKLGVKLAPYARAERAGTDVASLNDLIAAKKPGWAE
jgi:hypothetical protein